MSDNLMQQAVTVRDETNVARNTAERIGKLFVDIVGKLGQHLAAENVSFEASATGVNLVLKATGAEGDVNVSKIPIPLNTDALAGIVTPTRLNSMKSTLESKISAETSARSAADTSIQLLVGQLNADLNVVRTTANAAVPSAQKGVGGGVAPLDASGKIPSSHLPSYMDDVVEFNGFDSNTISFAPGGNDYPSNEFDIFFSTTRNCFFFRREETINEQTTIYHYDEWTTYDKYQSWNGSVHIPLSGKVYLCKSDGKGYRWSGSTLLAVGNDLAIGETEATAFAGNRGLALEQAVDGTLLKKVAGTAIDAVKDAGFYLVGESTSTALMMVAGGSYGTIIQYMITSQGGDDELYLRYRVCKNNVWGDWQQTGGTASAGIYNVTNAEPIAGFYELSNPSRQSISAVHVAWNNKMAMAGLILSFEISAGIWKTYQYIGDSLKFEDGRTSDHSRLAVNLSLISTMYAGSLMLAHIILLNLLSRNC